MDVGVIVNKHWGEKSLELLSFFHCLSDLLYYYTVASIGSAVSGSFNIDLLYHHLQAEA